jgi:ketosteroid isomerase-like protein
MFDDPDQYESPLYEQQRRFASSFYRKILPKYEAALGHVAAVNFTRWWREWRTYRTVTNQFARTQREFNIEAQAASDGWLNVWAQDTTQKIIDGEPEAAPTPQDDVEKLQSAWGIDAKKAKRFSETIRRGVKRYVPELRNKDVDWTGKSLLFSGVVSPGESDAIQDAWVALLTKSDTVRDGDAYSAGGSAGRKIVRKGARIVSISQLQSTDPDAPETTLDSVQKFLTEEDYAKDVDAESEKDDAATQDAVRLAILNQFKQESPDDYAFIVDYLIRDERVPRFRNGHIISIAARGAKVTPEEQKRARGILSNLRKQEASIS